IVISVRLCVCCANIGSAKRLTTIIIIKTNVVWLILLNFPGFLFFITLLFKVIIFLHLLAHAIIFLISHSLQPFYSTILNSNIGKTAVGSCHVCMCYARCTFNNISLMDDTSRLSPFLIIAGSFGNK